MFLEILPGVGWFFTKFLFSALNPAVNAACAKKENDGNYQPKAKGFMVSRVCIVVVCNGNTPGMNGYRTPNNKRNTHDYRKHTAPHFIVFERREWDANKIAAV